ncbi:MAG: DUF2783 domain-containing protein [Pseudomonadota bacterium]|nr:DUF2783 domain-containing protein [Pseudomonadota bacterium]
MLNTAFNLDSADDFYAALIDAHRDLTAAQSHALNAKLVLLLANHIGTLAVLREALAAARANTVGERVPASASTIDRP